jgi:hypothetical protein
LFHHLVSIPQAGPWQPGRAALSTVFARRQTTEVNLHGCVKANEMRGSLAPGEAASLPLNPVDGSPFDLFSCGNFAFAEKCDSQPDGPKFSWCGATAGPKLALDLEQS